MIALGGSLAPSVRIVRILPAPPQEVFAAWTDAQSVKEWMCPGTTTVPIVELDVRVGGHFKIVMRDKGGDYVHTGEYREIDPPNRLVFTWVSPATHDTPTLVTVDFRPHGDGGTELVLVHEQFPDEQSAAKHQRGWDQIATKMAAYLGKRAEQS